MRHVSYGTLSDIDIKFSDKSACCVILASDGYPVSYEKGYRITLPKEEAGEYIFVAGAALNGGALVTSGGRVIGAAAVGDTLSDAVSHAYALSDKIHFNNKYLRHDIGKKALMAEN